MVNIHIPLAETLRPKTFDEYVGQSHIVGKGAVLQKALISGTIPSMILWGPPGVGKTTLANIIAASLNMHLFSLSAVSSGVKEVRHVIEQAGKLNGKAILFIDEIHRFSKSQQDSLLNAVERGVLTLIGATTENPSFEVITPLLSRCQVYVLKPLSEQELDTILYKAVEWYNSHNQEVEIVEKDALFRVSGGDARKLYNALQLVVGALSEKGSAVKITNEKVTGLIQQNLAAYDKLGETHYDIISAFIKSVRGSDPDGAIYWLARMIAGGEDPKFIARRLLILAAEDIGLANPNALLLANSCFEALHKIGWPEGRIVLSEVTIYLATSPKSNTAYMAINSAQDYVNKTGDLPVPLHLRNSPTTLMKKLNYGANYKYAHDFPKNFIRQEYLPDDAVGAKFYIPGKNQSEEKIAARLKDWWGDKTNLEEK